MSKTQSAVSTSTAKKKNFLVPKKMKVPISSPIKYHQELAFEIEYYSSSPLHLCLPFRIRTSVSQ